MSQRIQKIIAQSGLASRREAESLIKQGRVKLNQKMAVLGDKATADDEIHVDGKRIESARADFQVLLLNKPEGYITTRKDPKGRKSVFELLPDINAGRWISVGRLDINTAGLLLFTSDGEFANQLMHPSSNIDREYMCRIFGKINDNKIKKLREGIKLDYDNNKSFFKSITALSSAAQNHWFKVVLTQGRYREVRRLWQAVDCQVNRLTRIRYGNICLPEDLKKGKFIYLSDQQLKLLRSSIALTK